MRTTACITGATGGLGRAFAVECANRGWDLFLTDISEDALNTLSSRLISTYGIKVIYFPCDLTDFASRTNLFDFMNDENLRFSYLINVAGLDFEGAFKERTREQIRTILRLNIEANLEMTNAVLKMQESRQPFRIVNVASLAAYYPMPVKAMYAASKRFLLDFSMALGEELRSGGGTVTVLCPAGMPTTDLCIKAIDSQGFAGRVTTKNVGFIASQTLNHAIKGHKVYIPGALNNALRFFGRFIPAQVIAHLIGNRWNKTQNKSEALAGVC